MELQNESALAGAVPPLPLLAHTQLVNLRLILQEDVALPSSPRGFRRRDSYLFGIVTLIEDVPFVVSSRPKGAIQSRSS